MDIALQFGLLADSIPQHIWGSNTRGELDYKNLQGRLYFGIADDAPGLGSSWADLVHQDDVARVVELWTYALEHGTPYEAEMRMLRSDGAFIWHLAKALPFREPSGTVMRWFGTNTDISRQKRVEELLARKVEDLTQIRASLSRSNADLEHFATIASHDLRAPLRSLRACLDDLRADPADHEAMSLASKSVARMMALIDGLLVASRFAGARLERSWVPLAEALDDAEENLHIDIVESHAVVTRHGALPKVWANKIELVELLQNLMSNSIRYAGDRSPHIHVSAQQGYEAATVQVRDEGIGFPQSQAHSAFEMFRRLPGSENLPGLGVGLAVCRWIIQHHGGKISARSAPGQGALVEFTLPEPSIGDRTP